jgi:hypothetical protein
VPDTTGGFVLDGGVAEGAGLVTTAVCADRAVADEREFHAFTETRIVWPTSLAATTYEEAVAPATAAHWRPLLLQSSQE